MKCLIFVFDLLFKMTFSTHISIVEIAKRWDDDAVDESDTHVEARDRRYSCLKKRMKIK